MEKNIASTERGVHRFSTDVIITHATNSIKDFEAFCHAMDFPVPQLTPNRLVRFSRPGRTDASCYAILFPSGDGLVKDFREGRKFVFHATAGERTQAEIQRFAEMQEAMKKKLRAQHEECAHLASDFWNSCEDASTNHPYLVRKCVGAYGIRQDYFGNLVIPLCDMTGKIWSIQKIYPNGKKSLLKGARKQGCFYKIGTGEPKFLAEGYATSFSVFQATNKACVMAVDAYNLRHVAPLFPNCCIVADNDASGVGEQEARKAQSISGNKVVVIPVINMDANDFLTAGYDLAGLLREVL